MFNTIDRFFINDGVQYSGGKYAEISARFKGSGKENGASVQRLVPRKWLLAIGYWLLAKPINQLS
jgi:hypothetical protein